MHYPWGNPNYLPREHICMCTSAYTTPPSPPINIQYRCFLQSHLADERHIPLHEDLTVSQIVKKWLQSFALQSRLVINFSLFHG